MNRMTDIFGNMPKVGDRVAYAEPSTSTIAYMKVGTVLEVTKDSITINREYDGSYASDNESNKMPYEYHDVLKPRKHCKFIILNLSDSVSDVSSEELYGNNSPLDLMLIRST